MRNSRAPCHKCYPVRAAVRALDIDLLGLPADLLYEESLRCPGGRRRHILRSDAELLMAHALATGTGQAPSVKGTYPQVFRESFSQDLLPPGFPNIDMGPQLKVVERTRTATMLCAASGNPDPEITWFKDFLPIDPNASSGRIKQLRSEGTPIRVKKNLRRRNQRLIVCDSQPGSVESFKPLWCKRVEVEVEVEVSEALLFSQDSAVSSSEQEQEQEKGEIPAVNVYRPLFYNSIDTFSTGSTPWNHPGPRAAYQHHNNRDQWDTSASAAHDCPAASLAQVPLECLPFDAAPEESLESSPSPPAVPRLPAAPTCTSSPASQTLTSSPVCPCALQIENTEETDQGKYECVASNVEGVRYSSPANLYVRDSQAVAQLHRVEAERFSLWAQRLKNIHRVFRGVLLLKDEPSASPRHRVGVALVEDLSQGVEEDDGNQSKSPITHQTQGFELCQDFDNALRGSLSSAPRAYHLLPLPSVVHLLLPSNCPSGLPTQLSCLSVPPFLVHSIHAAPHQLSCPFPKKPLCQLSCLPCPFPFLINCINANRPLPPLPLFLLLLLLAISIYGLAASVFLCVMLLSLTFRRVPPRFSILPTSHEIMPGGSVNITCVAVGSPMPYVKWMLNSEDLTPEDEMPVGRNVLELNGIRESANYTCVAMSSLGIIETIAQITVKSLPKPPGKPVVTETTATSITITWDSGNPEPVSHYIIQYRSTSPESKFETVDSITTTRYSIGGLSPNMDYEIRVSAYNTIGQGPPSEQTGARTGEQAPASPPRNIQALIISQNTMMVRWDEPEEPNGQIKGYRVYYTMDPTLAMSLWQIHNVHDSVITTIQSLVSSETYTIRVLAFTSVGDGPFSDPIHVKVLQGVPGQPSKFQIGEVSDTSVQLTWEPAFEKEGIISYELHYKEGNDGLQIKKSFSPTSSFVVENLRPNTEYHFSLAAISHKGIGAFTNEISQKTSQANVHPGQVSAPGLELLSPALGLAEPSAAPQDVQCSSSSSTSLLVSWRPPPVQSQNGALSGYTVRYAAVGAGSEWGTENVEAPATEQILLQRLEKWTMYRVSVSASTDVGLGPESEPLLCRTDEDVPGAPPRRVEVEVLNSTAIKVMWRSLLPGKQHGQIRGYQVHYVRVENGESRGLPLIKDVMLADAQWEMDESAEYEMDIGGLQPDTTYSITVAAYTTKGDGARSKAKLVVTPGADPRPSVKRLSSERDGRSAGGDRAASDGSRCQAGLGGDQKRSVLVNRSQSEVDRVPGPPLLFVSLISETAALVHWQPPNVFPPGLDVQGYRLQFGRKDVTPLATLEFAPQETEFSFGNIHRGATYLFKVSAKSKSGFGEEATHELEVPEQVPRGYPQITEESNVTCCSVQFSWLPPVLAEQNGAITEYTLAYQETGISGTPKELRLPASENSYTLNSLRPNVVYDVKIRAHTSVGPGPYSPPIQYRTVAYEAVQSSVLFVPNERLHPFPLHSYHRTLRTSRDQSSCSFGKCLQVPKALPGFYPMDVPKNFTVKLVTKTTALLSWKFSESRFPGGTRCMIEYYHQKVSVEARMTKALITNLRPNTTYEFRITCQESSDGGPKHKLIARTAPPILVRKPELDLKREPDNTLTIVFPPLESKDLIKTIYVVVVPLKKGRGPIRHIKNPDELDLEEVNTNTSFSSGFRPCVSDTAEPEPLKCHCRSVVGTFPRAFCRDRRQLPSSYPRQPGKRPAYTLDLELWREQSLPLLGERRLGQRQTRTTRQLHQADGKRPYIAASFRPSSMPQSFILGNQMIFGGFENRLLDPGQEYVLFLLAELNTTGVKSFASSPYTDPVVAPDVDPQPLESGGDGLIWVVGPVLAVVFIICIVIAILLYKK
ncbi:hypothetical protein DNTS_025785 [Danionella cerebrum]|uniref:protein-tyrosine-phosphatase n=1 Tax=Danionella cerebrum TaxID=2873325 RepID=A0A553N4M1_9TELE|nr:hypothetical protein DNTS_025785 [Danionella translucida]